MSFFGNYGVTVDEVNENPFSIPFNTYPVVISGAEVKTFKKNPEIEYFVIEYQIASGTEAGKIASRMFRQKPLTQADDAQFATQNARTLSNFKKALMELGLTEGEINTFEPKTDGRRIIGIRGYATMGPQKNNAEYNQVSDFTLSGATADEDSVESESKVGSSDSDSDKLGDLLGGNW